MGGLKKKIMEFSINEKRKEKFDLHAMKWILYDMGPLTLARERFLDYDMFGLISGQVTQDKGVKLTLYLIEGELTN